MKNKLKEDIEISKKIKKSVKEKNEVNVGVLEINGQEKIIDIDTCSQYSEINKII